MNTGLIDATGVTRSAERSGRVLLRADSVSKFYGSFGAVRQLSLEVREGEFLSLLGPSGSGKSTLLNLISGFTRLDEGAIFIDGQDMQNVPPHRRGLGVVFQDRALFPHMSVHENVAFGLEARREPRAEITRKVRDALGLVGLAELASRRPGQLSGGQQQRVALARALVYEPSLLLLDEPLGALDRRLRDDLQVEIKKLHSRLGITFILVTHDQEEALSLSDQIAVMRDGVIEQIGAPAELYDSPVNRFVASFIGDCNLIEGHSADNSGGVEIRHPTSGARLHQGPSGRDPSHSGKNVCVAIRPEWLELAAGPERTNGAEPVAATIEVVRFRGSDVLVECNTVLGTVLARVHRDAWQELGARGVHGGEVWLTWSPSRTWPLWEEQ